MADMCMDANQGVAFSIPGPNIRLSLFQHSLSSGILHKGLSGDSTVRRTKCAMTSKLKYDIGTKVLGHYYKFADFKEMFYAVPSFLRRSTLHDGLFGI